MRRSHLEAFAPVCVRCRLQGRGEPPLTLEQVHAASDDGDDILDAMLACKACQYEYPVLDGIPFLVPDVREHVGKQLHEIRAREDLSPYTESLLGDCAGPDSDFGRMRLYQASYGLAHWGDRDAGGPGGGGLVPVIEAAFGLADQLGGRWLDLGCSVGRGTFELAARTGELALGVDVSVAMLRAARRIARTGRLRYPVRRVGVVFDHRDVLVEHAAAPQVDFWYADVTALPFATGSAAGAISLNVLDAVTSPLMHLHELARVLVDDARAVVATPYDWTASVTPIEGWIGGHSQRSRLHGSSADELRVILAATDRPEGAPALVVDADRTDVTWSMALHERATVTYKLDMVRLRPFR